MIVSAELFSAFVSLLTTLEMGCTFDRNKRLCLSSSVAPNVSPCEVREVRWRPTRPGPTNFNRCQSATAVPSK